MEYKGGKRRRGKNPGPETEAHKEEESTAKQELVVRQFNVTNLNKNGNHILMQEADIVGVAEHKLSEGQMAEWKAKFRDGYWKLTGSKADERGKTPQAGVALATKQFIKHIEAPIKTESFRQAHQLGRACKMLVDVGWVSNFCIYEAYGMARGHESSQGFQRVAH